MRKIIRYLTTICISGIFLFGCKLPQITQSIEQRQKTTITEQLVDTSIHIGADSLLSAFQYKIDSGQLIINPLWQFGSNILSNVLRVDTATKMLYLNTKKSDTIVKIWYKNITKIDSFYVKIKEKKYITTNELNGWQQVVQWFGYAMMIMMLFKLIIWGITMYLKTKIK